MVRFLRLLQACSGRVATSDEYYFVAVPSFDSAGKDAIAPYYSLNLALKLNSYVHWLSIALYFYL